MKPNKTPQLLSITIPMLWHLPKMSCKICFNPMLTYVVQFKTVIMRISRVFVSIKHFLLSNETERERDRAKETENNLKGQQKGYISANNVRSHEGVLSARLKYRIFKCVNNFRFHRNLNTHTHRDKCHCILNIRKCRSIHLNQATRTQITDMQSCKSTKQINHNT